MSELYVYDGLDEEIEIDTLEAEYEAKHGMEAFLEYDKKAIKDLEVWSAKLEEAEREAGI